MHARRAPGRPVARDERRDHDRAAGASANTSGIGQSRTGCVGRPQQQPHRDRDEEAHDEPAHDGLQPVADAPATDLRAARRRAPCAHPFRACGATRRATARRTVRPCRARAPAPRVRPRAATRRPSAHTAPSRVSAAVPGRSSDQIRIGALRERLQRRDDLAPDRRRSGPPAPATARSAATAARRPRPSSRAGAAACRYPPATPMTVSVCDRRRGPTRQLMLLRRKPPAHDVGRAEHLARRHCAEHRDRLAAGEVARVESAAAHDRHAERREHRRRRRNEAARRIVIAPGQERPVERRHVGARACSWCRTACPTPPRPRRGPAATPPAPAADRWPRARAARSTAAAENSACPIASRSTSTPDGRRALGRTTRTRKRRDQEERHAKSSPARRSACAACASASGRCCRPRPTAPAAAGRASAESPGARPNTTSDASIDTRGHPQRRQIRAAARAARHAPPRSAGSRT